MQIMVESFLKFIFTLIEFLPRVIYEAIFGGSVINANTGYNAGFVDESILIKSANTGFILNGKKALSNKDSFRNLLLIGNTGSGKSTVVNIPAINHITHGSIIVNDPSGELYTKTSSLKRKQNFKIYVLNFLEISHSLAYNPLFYANSISEINRVASLIVRTTTKRGNEADFWITQAINTISVTIAYLKACEPYEYQNLYNVRKLIGYMAACPEKVDIMFAKSPEHIFSEYRNLAANEPKVYASIISSALSSLQLLVDDSIAKLTSQHQIDFKKFREEKSILYITQSTMDTNYLKPIVSIIFEQLFTQLTLKLPTPKELDVFMVIDEFSSLMLPTISLFLANCRKARIGVCCSIQSISQLDFAYGKENSISIYSNCVTKLFFSGATHNDALLIESLLGKKEEVIDERGTTKISPLLNSESARTLDPSLGIIVHASTKPIITKLTPWFENFWMRIKMEDAEPFINPYSIDEVPILPLPQ